MTTNWLNNRATSPAVALETTILVHGLPRDRATAVADDVARAIAESGAHPAVIGLLEGIAIIGMTNDELQAMLDRQSVQKLNRSNLGLAIAAKQWGATTVSASVEIAHLAGIRIFATGGIGGVHTEYHTDLDISSDLIAIANHPVAVVTSGCKNVLDVNATREALETLGIPVVGYRCDSFPAFYQRETDIAIDRRFDDHEELADFLRFELARTQRGIVVCNPIPIHDEIPAHTWDTWILEARGTTIATGRNATPAILAAIHGISRGRTVSANIALAIDNARIAGQLAAALEPDR